MSALAPFPNRAVSRPANRYPRDSVSETLAEVERDARALQGDMSFELSRLDGRQPELSVWITTSLWLLELTARDLAIEHVVSRRRAGISLAVHHAMRASAGLEIAWALGLLEVHPERWDKRLTRIVSKLERARGEP